MRNDTHDNDNFDPWSSLGLATAMILNRLQNQRALLELAEKEHEDGKRQTGRDSTEEQRAEDQREYVNTRLKELASFERRASGRKT